ncbi:hypothetical protein AB5J72_35795 [Streptomyces sp. CG1]|uniref:hypothetical protein n=1 Tax=Streptomyces sp. CG1 TaxID=1287523 RepID=UPI0034E1C117
MVVEACYALKHGKPQDLISALAITGRANIFIATHVPNELLEHLPRVAACASIVRCWKVMHVCDLLGSGDQAWWLPCGAAGVAARALPRATTLSSAAEGLQGPVGSAATAEDR